MQKIRHKFGYEYIDLDVVAEVHNGSEYPKRGVEIIKATEGKNDGKSYIIDIGAGFQNREDLFEFFEARKSRLICVYASPNVAFARNTGRPSSYWRDRTFDAYKQCEYSRHRERLYALGKKIVNDDLDDTIEEVKKIIKSF